MLVLEHVGICAKDTTALKDWYVKLFGFEVVYDNKKENPTYFLLMEDKSMLEIMPAEEVVGEVTSPTYQGIRHLAFGTDNIEEQFQKLLDNGVEIISEIEENKGTKKTFFRDLEGNILHFIQREKKLVEK